MAKKNCSIQLNRMILKRNNTKFKHRKIAFSNPQLFIVCQESTTAIKWLNTVDKMIVGLSESLYRRWL